MSSEPTSTVIYTVRKFQSGQPRPYADSIYTAEIELDGDWYGKRPDFGEEVIKRAASALVRPFTAEKGDESRKWYETYLDQIIKKEPHTWFVRIVQPYCD
jgi:hypothetical protein